MIDLKDLRANPNRYREGAVAKQIDVDIDALLDLDASLRQFTYEMEGARASQNSFGKENGPKLGKLKGQLKRATEDERVAIEAQIRELEEAAQLIKGTFQSAQQHVAKLTPKLNALLLKVPQPPDADVPQGNDADDNVELRLWNPAWFDPTRPFEENKGFPAQSHIDLMQALGMVDFPRAVKMAGSRSFVLAGDGMRLQQAVLNWAFDAIVNEYNFQPMSVPVIVREECMTGTAFFPSGREQAYHIEESRRGAGHDLFLTGTGEVGLMGLHADEILDGDQLPLQYATISTCFRREAGAAGKDTAGLYRMHQFDKVEQVVICWADEQESRQWHQKMMAIVEDLLQRLELPYRLLQCCTGDLGPKNADMIDIECWMPSRPRKVNGEEVPGSYGETHSASRLYDYQCRRLNLRYRGENGKTIFCHSLNNTVVASPRILIPIVEMYQNADGSITIPKVLQPYMNNQQRIG